MKPRLLIALVVVLALFLGGGLVASANDDEPHCWYVSYTISVMGTKIVKIPKTCVPCLRFCGLLPSGSPPHSEGRFLVITPGG